MDRITFGETDGDAEANCLRDCVGYVVALDGEDHVLMGVSNTGITVRRSSDSGVGKELIDRDYGSFTELHIY